MLILTPTGHSISMNKVALSVPALPNVPAKVQDMKETAGSLMDAAAENSGFNSLVAFFTQAIASLYSKSNNTHPEGIGFYSGKDFFQVRMLTSNDTKLLQNFLQNELSEESRRKRFLQAMPRVSMSVAEYLAQRDGQDRVAVIALKSTEKGDIIVGMVEYALVSGSTEPPEVALAVSDAYQGRGIGKHLLGLLATLSLAGGHSVWSGEVLVGNSAVLHTLYSVGTVRTLGSESGVLHIEIDIDQAKVFNTAVG